MMGDGSLPKRCPTKYQMIVVISGNYNVKYCVRNERDKTQCITIAIRLVMISGDYHVEYCVRNGLDKTECI